jgi:hypothetical protein
MVASLESVHLKLIRAQEHLEAIIGLLADFSVGKCEIVTDEDKNAHVGFMRVHLPKPPKPLNCVIADCLYNIRSALDHIVWQLVLANPPNAPNGRNAFPICSSGDNFEAAKKRHRLDGIPTTATTLIESLQPYLGRNQTLLTLSALHERDKHQTLNLITAVARDTFIEWSGSNSFLKIFIGGEELRDGAIFGNVGIPLNDPQLLTTIGSNETLSSLRERFLKMKMEGQASIFVAFGDSAAEELEPLRVDTVLQEIMEFARDNIIPAFEPFFH